MIARDRILVHASPIELRPGPRGVVDVYDALNRQFFWADTVMLEPQVADADEDEVLEGEVVGPGSHT